MLETFALFGALLALYRWGCRPAVVVPVFVFAPAVLLWNAGRVDLQVFTWVKVITLAVSMQVFAAFLLVRNEAWRARLAWAVVGILGLNILEAVVADAVAGHWLNALVGVSLILTMPGPARVQRGGEPPGLLYDTSWQWALAYTAWNLAVVAGIYPEHWTDHFAVLGVPLAAALLWGRARWLEARACSLSIYACTIVIAVDIYQAPWLPTSPDPSALYPWLSGLAALLAAWNALPSLAALRRAGAAG